MLATFRSWLERRWSRLYTRNIQHADRNWLVVVDPISPHQWTALIGCCDCGLMHRFDFYANDQGQLVLRAKRDPVATTAQRTAKEFPFQPHTSVEDRIRAELYNARP